MEHRGFQSSAWLLKSGGRRYSGLTVEKECPIIRSDLVRKFADTHPHVSPLVVEAAVESILNQIDDSLAQGKRVELRGFGSFASKIRKQRMSRDPRNGDPAKVEVTRLYMKQQ